MSRDTRRAPRDALVVFLRVVEVLVWLFTAVVAILWVRDPSSHMYHPWLELSAVFSAGVSALRHRLVSTRERPRRVVSAPHIDDHLIIFRALNKFQVEYLIFGNLTGLVY